MRLDGLTMRRRRLLEGVRRGVVAVPDEPEHHVAAIVLHLAVGELALDRDVRHAADLREGVVDVRVRADAVRSRCSRRAVAVDLVRERRIRDLCRDLGEADANRADFGAEDLAVVERLACGDGVVEPLEVDELQGESIVSLKLIGKREGRRTPQDLCVRTLALSMGPNDEKTASRWLGVVVGGIEPIQSALVG